MKKKKMRRRGTVLGDPAIKAHQNPASCLLSLSAPQSPGGSGLEDTDSVDDGRLAECGLVVVEVRKGKVGVRDEEKGWTPVVRRKRKKSAGCAGDGELILDGGSVMCFTSLNGIPETNIRDGSFRHWVAVKPSQASSRIRTKFKH